MDVVWDGIIRAETPYEDAVRVRHTLADAAKNYDWPRVVELLSEHRFLELDRPRMWFAVPGMYGGFSYRLEAAGVESKLVSESWCRVAGGSGQRHEITAVGVKLTEKGFV